jgi:hypothetical protein
MQTITPDRINIYRDFVEDIAQGEQYPTYTHLPGRAQCVAHLPPDQVDFLNPVAVRHVAKWGDRQALIAFDARYAESTFDGGKLEEVIYESVSEIITVDPYDGGDIEAAVAAEKAAMIRRQEAAMEAARIERERQTAIWAAEKEAAKEAARLARFNPDDPIELDRDTAAVAVMDADDEDDDLDYDDYYPDWLTD